MAISASGRGRPRNILFAPLNWGLGHATRDLPLIHHFLEKGDTTFQVNRPE